jgi:hypothetical protein
MAMKPVLRRMDAATYVKDIETSRAFYELLGFYELQSGRGPASAWSAMRNGRDTVLLTCTQVVVPVLAAWGRLGADGLHVTGGISAIHTSCQVGGITRALSRASVRGSLTVVASAPR